MTLILNFDLKGGNSYVKNYNKVHITTKNLSENGGEDFHGQSGRAGREV